MEASKFIQTTRVAAAAGAAAAAAPLEARKTMVPMAIAAITTPTPII